MTDERKKFLASISKEEQATRQAISDCRRMIKQGKEGIGKYKDRPSCFGKILLENFKDDVRFNKIYLKYLKKMLPAPTIEEKWESGKLFGYRCVICDNLSPHCQSYCNGCGQKLR